MSVLNIGMNDISDHDRAMKDKLANAHIAALQEQLSKKAEEMHEINKNHNDNLRKLVDQNTRIAQLEDDIKAQSSLTTKEKMSFQNAEQTLAGARATIKEREMDIKELELKLDDLSRLSDEHRTKSDKLTKDKSMLEIRVRELQATSVTAPPLTPLPRRRRSPSPSPASDQLQALKHELTELRSIVQEKEAGALAANQKAFRAHEAQVRLENEKAALEKRLTREITALKVALQEKEDEMRSHDTFVAEARHREQELEERIESDEKRHSDRIKSLQSDLKMTENSVRSLTNDLEQSRTRNVELFAENERVLKELKETQRAAEDTPRNGNTALIDDEAATHLQRLLSATSRLRAERDTLRTERDDLHGRLEFLQAESKFKIEAMHAAFVAPSTHSFAEHHTASFAAGSAPSDSPERVSKLHRLTLATMAFATAVQHLDTEARTLALRASTAESCCVDLEIQLTKSQIDVAESHHKLRQMAVESNVESLTENSRANDELRLQLDVKSSQLAQAIAATKGAEDAQEFYKRQYDDVESQRSSLALEVTNLTNELSSVRNDVKMAEDKYTELQRHQFDTMSKTDRMRLLQNELKEERGRVERRDEHIKMLQHDIARMETTVVLHEERLNEMTAEFDSMAAAKEAMVEDCAEARDARDNALLRLEQMEVALEAHAEEGDRTVEELLRVLMQTIGNARQQLSAERQRVDFAKAALMKLEEEHRAASNMETLLSSEEAKQYTIALAVSQVGFGSALRHNHEMVIENQKLQYEVTSRQNDWMNNLQDGDALVKQLEVSPTQANSAALEHSNLELKQRIQDLERTISIEQATHHAAMDDLIYSKDQLLSTLRQAQSLASTSDEEITRLQKQYTEQLEETRAQLFGAEQALEELRTSHMTSRNELHKALEDAKELRQQLDKRVAGSAEDDAARRDLIAQQEQEISRLRDDIKFAQSSQHTAEVALQDLRDSFECLKEKFDALTDQHKNDILTITDKNAASQQEMEGRLAELQTQLNDQSSKLDEARRESEFTNQRLEEEIDAHHATNERHQKDLSAVQLELKDAETVLAQVQEETESNRAQLLQSTEQVDRLQREKLSLQEAMTTLEAEVQKSMSARRYLESQVKESEEKMASFTTEIDEVRAELARSEKATNAAEVGLSLQGAQHKREMLELNRQLSSLRAQTHLQSALAELEQRNDEMEELLRKKCAEIEENDDRALEMLKENKKLATKVESLTRKVQTLQAKLAAAKASIPTPLETPQMDAASQLVSTSSTPPSKAPAVTASVTPIAEPPLPAFLSSAPPQAPSTAARTPIPRAVSGPSSLPRSKTPEQKGVEHSSIFKSKTPERTISSPPTEGSTSSVGKKRPAPDDFDTCESLPPQGFTPDCVPSKESSGSTTPRPRRFPSALPTGFTPVRNKTRPIISIPSPKRLMTMKSGERSSPLIADVTNSPRGQSGKGKRTWLGKIRGTVSSQATNRPLDSRQEFKRDTS